MIGQRLFRRLRARSAYAMLMVSYVGLLVFSMVFASVSYVRLYHSAQKRAEEQAYRSGAKRAMHVQAAQRSSGKRHM